MYFICCNVNYGRMVYYALVVNCIHTSNKNKIEINQTSGKLSIKTNCRSNKTDFNELQISMAALYRIKEYSF